MFGFCNDSSDLVCLVPGLSAGGGPPTGWPLTYPYTNAPYTGATACNVYKDDFYAYCDDSFANGSPNLRCEPETGNLCETCLHACDTVYCSAIINGVSVPVASAAWDTCTSGCTTLINECSLDGRTHPTDCTPAPPVETGDCVRPLQADSRLSMHFGGLAKGCINTLQNFPDCT
jgi:hypothetical protein